MREWTVKDLPVYHVVPTGEIGVEYINGRWERNGQRLLCPVSRVLLEQQPRCGSWVKAASLVLGWSLARTLAFKLSMGHAPLSQKGNSSEAQKGIVDANLYGLLYKLARKIHR